MPMFLSSSERTSARSYCAPVLGDVPEFSSDAVGMLTYLRNLSDASFVSALIVSSIAMFVLLIVMTDYNM